MLVGRARWLWTRTTPAARRAYHAAGLGYAAGQFLDAQRDTLVPLLLSAEGALLRGAAAEAAHALVAFARHVRAVPPFEFEDAPGVREAALSAWVTGDLVSAPPLAGDASEIVAFLQGDVVYRLVWAAEAVRLHAVQTGVPDAELLDGTVAATLTYGLPTAPGIVLAQAGLSSRTMVQRLVAAFPTGLSGPDDIADWIAAHRGVINAPGYWQDTETEALWQAFVGRWIDRAPGRWGDRRTEVGVEWRSPRQAPETGASVSLVHDPVDNVTYVCAEDLTHLGRLRSPVRRGPANRRHRRGGQRSRTRLDHRVHACPIAGARTSRQRGRATAPRGVTVAHPVRVPSPPGLARLSGAGQWATLWAGGRGTQGSCAIRGVL